MPAFARFRASVAGISGYMVALAGVLLLCGTVRLALIEAKILRLDADEAVTGLMARRILAGDDFYVYYAGQKYMGAAEQYLQAASLAVLPDNPFTLRLPEVLLSVATCFFVYAAASRALGSREWALFAAGLYATGPFFTVLFGVKVVGALCAAGLVSMVAVWLALGLEPQARNARWIALGLGVCVGLGFWLTWSSAFVLVAVSVWALYAAFGRITKLAPFAFAGFLVGALPVWAFVLKYHELPTPLASSVPPSTLYERAEAFVNAIAPMFLGFEVFGGAPVADWLPSAILMLAVVGVLGVACFRRLASWSTQPFGRRRGTPVDLVLLVFLLSPFIWIASSYGYFTGEPRYLHAMAGVLPIGVAALMQAAGRHRIAAAATVSVAWLGLMALSIDRVHDVGGSGEVIDGQRVRTECLSSAVRSLTDAGARSVYGSYWVVYPLKFVADDELDVAPFAVSRFPEMTARVHADPNPAYAVPVGTAADVLAQRLAAAGARAQRRTACDFVLFTDLRPVLRPWQLAYG